MPIIFILSLFKIEVGITALKALGFSFHEALVFVLVWTIAVTTMEYYSVNPVKKRIDKLLNKLNNKRGKNGTNGATERFWREKVREPVERGHKKALGFLINHTVFISVVILALPFTFLLDIAGIVAIRRSGIKYGVLIAILATMVKVSLTLSIFY